MTLKMWLVEKLNAEELQPIDIAHLSAIDITNADGSEGTMANMIDENSFEHMRIVPKQDCKLGQIFNTIQAYYVSLGFKLNKTLGGGAIGLIFKKRSESVLVTFFIEKRGHTNTVWNITVNGPTGHAE